LACEVDVEGAGRKSVGDIGSGRAMRETTKAMGRRPKTDRPVRKPPPKRDERWRGECGRGGWDNGRIGGRGRAENRERRGKRGGKGLCRGGG